MLHSVSLCYVYLWKCVSIVGSCGGVLVHLMEI